jgi:hypothetical protein
METTAMPMIIADLTLYMMSKVIHTDQRVWVLLRQHPSSRLHRLQL